MKKKMVFWLLFWGLFFLVPSPAEACKPSCASIGPNCNSNNLLECLLSRSSQCSGNPVCHGQELSGSCASSPELITACEENSNSFIALSFDCFIPDISKRDDGTIDPRLFACCVTVPDPDPCPEPLEKHCCQPQDCRDPIVCSMGSCPNQGEVCCGYCEPPPECDSDGDGVPNGIYTALGCLNVTNFENFFQSVNGIILGIAGGIAFLLILIGSFLILTSSGEPEKVQNGKQFITSAVIGLLIIIFAIFLYRLIGVEILHLPDFS